VVLIALRLAVQGSMERGDGWFSADIVDRVNELVRQGCDFLLDNYRDVPGGKGKSIVPNREENDPLTHFEQVVYTSWGLRALALNRNFIRAGRIELVRTAIVPGFVDRLTKQALKLRFFAHEAVSSTGSVLQYQHRSGVGGIISTLALLSRFEFLGDINMKEFGEAVRKVFKAVRSLRNPTDKLWCRDAKRINMMPSIVLDLLYFTRYLDGYGKLPLADADLEALLVDTLFANRVLDGLAQQIRTVLLDVVGEQDVAKLYDKLSGARKEARRRKRKKADEDDDKKKKRKDK
jgi:hypothetical protein